MLHKAGNEATKFYDNYSLTLIWVGFLGVCFEVGGGVKLPPPPGLKLVRDMLETSNLVHKHTLICSFRNITFGTKALLVLLMSAFFCKKSVLFG